MPWLPALARSANLVAVLYRLFFKLFFTPLDAEIAHHIGMTGIRFAGALGLTKLARLRQNPRAAVQVMGLHFDSPFGLAAGFDKNAKAIKALGDLGFSHVEIGTVTAQAQPGNEKPRLFRLIADRALINRMGFNNEGQAAAIARLQNIPDTALAGPLGINIGANKDSADRVADYVIGVRNMEALADYLTVNISSPNTPGLRALQDKAALDDLLAQVMAARTWDTPVFLKVAPDLQLADIDDIVAVAMSRGIAALIVSNTTISRPALISRHKGETGGLSGAPLRDMAQQRVIDFRKASGGQLPLIGVGGVTSAEDAYARIRAGASLVQIYSALVYQGPGLARKINKQLARLLKADGFSNIAEAIGVDG